MAQAIADGRIIWPKRPNGRPRLKRYLSDMLTETTGFSTVLEAPGNVEATKELSRILGPKAFAFPKPSDLIKLLVAQATNPGDLILDSFAGSGTTGHAVLALNAEAAKASDDIESTENGDLFPTGVTAPEPRRFILCEIEPKIAREITAERLRLVIAGYGETPGLGGGFRFCTLGEPMLDEEARFHPDVKWSDLGHHLWFTETGEPWSAERAAAQGAESLATGGPMLGTAPDGRAIYLFQSSLLRGQNGYSANVLTAETLTQLAPHAGPRVVYGEACTLRASALSRERIVFKQIPYQVRQQ